MTRTLRLSSLVLAAILLATATLQPSGGSARWVSGQPLTAADQALLEDLERRAFRYFDEQADPATGLVRDRARTNGAAHDEAHRDLASIAATGFGLTSLCVAADRGWTPRDVARARARTTVLFLADRMPHQHGWFHHFVNARTGAREWQSELSSIDTVWLLTGVLTVRQCFSDDSDIVRAADAVYRRVDFPWMLNGDPALLSMGWTPESGFIPSRWDHYCELMALYLLAIGSPSHPVPASAWRAWSRPRVTFEQYQFVGGPDPLFVHQYSHAWIDFRGRHEDRAPFIDWWRNSIVATRAHRAFCIGLSRQFPGYSSAIWGITASDGPNGYQAWGGPPAHGPIDGTVVPAAAAGSLMFAPDITLPALHAMRTKFGARIYDRYGFADAFNPNTGWIDPDVIGIDVGIGLLSIENLRTGNVWRWTMANPEIPAAMNAAGLATGGRAATSRPGPAE